MKIALLFGSFNPVHFSHLAIAEHFLKFAKLDQVWLVLSPLNPHKVDLKFELASFEQRWEMLELALSENQSLKNKIIPCVVEKNLPLPSYTYYSLELIKKKNPNHQFWIILGEDNYLKINTWFKGDEIAENENLLIYPRKEGGMSLTDDSFTEDGLQYYEISSTKIREKVRARMDGLEKDLPLSVIDYIKKKNLYQNT